MNFRILAASVRPRGRVFALLAATALTAALLASRRAGPSAGSGAGRRRRRPRPKAAPKAAPAPRRRPAAPAGRRPPAAAPPRRRRPARGPAGSADLCALDQILPEGPGCQRQAGLLHRQGRPHRVRPAGHRRRHHRARRRAEEDPARHAAARHAAGSRHPRHRRQQSAGAEPLCDLLPNGCMSDYEVTPELLANMKKGQNLVVQAINSNGAPLTLAAAAGGFRQGL